MSTAIKQSAVIYARVSSEEQGIFIQGHAAAGPSGRYDYVRHQVEDEPSSIGG